MHNCIFKCNIQLKLQLNSNSLMFYHPNNSHLINVVIFFFFLPVVMEVLSVKLIVFGACWTRLSTSIGSEGANQ